MVISIIAICFAADISGLPVNKCYMQMGEEFKSPEICEAWAYRKEDQLFRSMTEEYKVPVVINIVCRPKDTET